MSGRIEIACEICYKTIYLDLNDPTTYISKSVDENVLFGKLITVKTLHQTKNLKNNVEQHFNVVVLDQNGKYRAHADSFVKTISQSQSKTAFLGRIAVIGPGGAGKTRSIQEMANHLAGRTKYVWTEEKNMAGTLVVTPYSLSFPPNRMAVFNDNPGQSSLELIRQSVAQAGANYGGLLIFQDGISWNFREVGVHQGKAITEFIQDRKELPVAVISTKADLQANLSRKSVLDHHVNLIAHAIDNAKTGQEIGFFNRVKNQPREFNLTFYKGAFYFTQLEQLLVNALQTDLRSNPIDGMTQINLRYYIRSILMGFAGLIIEWMDQTKLGDIYPELNAFDADLITALNYYRPTAYETESDWEVIHGPGKNEPIVLKEVLDESSIRSVITHFTLGSKEKHNSHVQTLQDRLRNDDKPDIKWNVVDHVYTDTITNEGKKNLYSTFENFINNVESFSDKKEPDTKDLNLTEF